MRTSWLFPLLLLVGLATPGLPGSTAGNLVAQTPMHNCSFCHNLHGGSYSALSDWAVNEDLCLSCHGEAGPATVDRDGVQVAVPKEGRNDAGGTFVAHNGGKHTSATNCWDCHNHEGEAGSNFKMVQASMPTPSSGVLPVVFTAWTGTNSFADGDATYDGVCEVCHTATNYHKNTGPPGSHNFTADCTTCHQHGVGFAGAGGGCTGCHSSSQGGRRVIVAEFDRTSHHVDWAAGGLPAADSIPDSDCTTCHDQSQHQQGSVRLWNVDDPGNTAASVILTGNPNTSTTEAAKLESFCLACHDADGANGNTTPFTGGATVPPIDDTAWAASSHEGSTALAGCYGNGTFGCHASGHGSEKVTMLAPAGTAATAPDLAEEQEGFCLNCHDSGGPAGSDIASAFNRTINWVQTATGLNSNPNLNDRHDVQYAAQSVSGAAIECVACHNPHTATSAQPYILDPDPNDGHVPGTDWYFSGYQSAGDVLSEFCLDCHDGSFAPGTSDHTSPSIVNIQGTWGADGMGGRTASSANLRPGTGWTTGQTMPCRACHTAHARIDADANVTTLFSVVDTVLNKAGDTPLFYKGRKGSDPEIYDYAITDNVSKNDLTSGGYWCNTCHDRYSMTGKEDCYSCHMHGDGGRF